MNQNDSISFFMAFFAGIASFVSPCVLPLIPAYISIITGLSLEELQSEKEGQKEYILTATLFFVLGFSVIFTLLGASATFIGQAIFRYSNIIQYAGGTLIIVFGLHFTGLFKINLLYKEKRLEIKQYKKGRLIGTFLMGASFAVGWTPCIGPILSAIILYAATKETMFRGILLLFVYSMGLGIPFMATALALNKFLKTFNTIKKYFRWVEIISGAILILIGLLMITNNFQNYSFWIINKF